MKIISVDDEEMTVKYLERLLTQIQPKAKFTGFTEVEEAFSYLSENQADVALLDIEMGEYSGIELARRCKELCPKVNIIFVTGYSSYTMDALKLHASGYLMKPVRANDLRLELENFRHPILTESINQIRIQTFGNFEIFVDGKTLKFPLAKCRECLAYLVDRKGALVTVSELAAVLWEDKPFDSAVRNSVHQVISKLIKTLKKAEADDIIIRHSREIGIDRLKIDCDYYRALSGDVGQVNMFMGEYMNNYSWAEFTVGELINRKKSNFEHCFLDRVYGKE